MRWRSFVLIGVLAGVTLLPSPAAAQSFGIGPRFSFVRGDLASSTPSSTFLGGTMRLRTSPHLAIEGALDHRSRTSEDLTARVRETPIQGSLLIFPVKAVFAPYLLGGFGWYNQSTDFLDATGKTVLTTSSKRTGWHFGLGAEVQLAKHAALFGDYRYRFVHFGDVAVDSQPINIPLISAAKLSHQGSMWTTGMAFYF
jgi:hypothetical protein